MELVPVMFKLERRNLLPILTVTGICNDYHGMKQILLSKAVKMIEFSQTQLKGKVTDLLGHENDINIQEGMIAVRFYILFRNDEELNQAITRIRKEFG